MNDEEKRKYEAFQYWIQTNTERGVTAIPDNLCLFVVNLIEKLQKENEKYKRLSEMNLKNAEEFKNNMCEHRCLLKSENEELKKFITEGITVAPHSPYKNYRLDFLRENFVSKKKIKDKIEELKKEGDYRTADNPYGRIHFMEEPCDYKIQVLKELLESEDSKDGENKKSTNTIRNSRT